MQLEVVPTWPIGDDEVLVLVMAAGVNYNGVWAALGQPISPFDVHKQPFHVAGSDASGIVWAVGAKVKRWKVGDEVIVHCNQDDGDDEECNGGDPMFSPSQRIWGYETPDGSFAQFCRVQSRQLMHEAEASHLGRGGLLHADARHRLPHAVRPPAAHAQARRQRAGLGRLRRPRRVRRAARARPRAPTPSASSRTNRKRDYVISLGAKGVINRKDFNCWGQLPKVNSPEFNDWTKEARKFGKAIWDITGKRDVDIVFEHPGEQTFPVSTPGGQARRHGGVLRRHHGLQHHLRRALRLDAAEAHPGLALRASEAGLGGQPVRARPAHRSLHERGVPLGEDPARAHQDVEEPAPARQHGGAGQRAAHRPAHLRGRAGSGGLASAFLASPAFWRSLIAITNLIRRRR